MLKYFVQFSEVLAAFSEKRDGSMRLFGRGDVEPNQENRNAFFEKLGVSPRSVKSALLVHGKNVVVVSDDSPAVLVDTDALITMARGVFLSVTGADCFPVFFYDPEREIIGLAHAGWRGVVAGVAKETVNEMIQLGSKGRNIHVAIGPGICAKHYDIPPGRKALFSDWPSAIHTDNGNVCINLQAILKEQLLAGGIIEENLTPTRECTFCDKEKFFSYRRDKPVETQAMVAVIGMKG